MNDWREGPARFYDLNPNRPDDVPFYLDRLPSSECSVLELGCGTGRVAIPLAQRARLVHGLDNSEAMLRLARAKVLAANLGDRIVLSVGDITSFDLPTRFDLVIAPFRVLQNIESEEGVAGLLEGIRRHLKPNGRAILNAFRPSRSPEAMRTEWVSRAENLSWEVETAEGRVACFDRRARIHPERPVLYPELVYRRFANNAAVEESVLRIAMRYYYPDELLALLKAHSFIVTQTWGGYHGEVYGVGPELVVEFGVET